MDKLYYTIGEASELAGVPASTLRYWDKQGVLVPSRKQARRRYYTQEDIARARRIKELMEQGLTLHGAARKLDGKARVPPEITEEIEEILALVRKLLGAS